MIELFPLLAAYNFSIKFPFRVDWVPLPFPCVLSHTIHSSPSPSIFHATLNQLCILVYIPLSHNVLAFQQTPRDRSSSKRSYLPPFNIQGLWLRDFSWDYRLYPLGLQFQVPYVVISLLFAAPLASVHS